MKKKPLHEVSILFRYGMSFVYKRNQPICYTRITKLNKTQTYSGIKFIAIWFLKAFKFEIESRDCAVGFQCKFYAFTVYR